MRRACRRCGGALYVTSRNSFNQVRRRLPCCDPQFTQLDICPGCRVQVASEAVRRCVDVTDPGLDDPRQDPEPSTADMAYSDYLQTADWKIRREGALKRARFSCQVCSGKGDLHVHHRTYLSRGNEAESDLIVLCATCHKLFHENGKLAQGGSSRPLGPFLEGRPLLEDDTRMLFEVTNSSIQVSHICAASRRWAPKTLQSFASPKRFVATGRGGKYGAPTD